ncbi:MAG: hypothetical protein WC057_06735 [Dehalococcoidales bacterium]
MTERYNTPFGGITRATFEDLSESQKLDVIYDTLSRTCSDCRERIETLEHRKTWDTTASAIAGVIGGALAFIGSKLFGWGGN